MDRDTSDVIKPLPTCAIEDIYTQIEAFVTTLDISGDVIIDSVIFELTERTGVSVGRKYRCCYVNRDNS